MIMQPAAPTALSNRIASLDALRGFALLGILPMNVQVFAMVSPAYMNPTAFGDLNGTNYWVWYFSHMLADLKFISLFSMLFGAGIVLFAERQELNGLRPAAMHFRRLGWLLLIGLCHAYLVWHGDILVAYAICGAVIFFMRKLHPKTLLTCGLLVVGVASMLSLVGQWTMPYWSQEMMAEMSEEWLLAADDVEKRKLIFQGPWIGTLPKRAVATFSMQTGVFLFFTAWRAGGCMLIGMALYKWGALTGECSKRTYAWMLSGFAVGLPIIAYGIHRNFAVDWDIRYSFLMGSQFNYWGSLAVAIGYTGLINLMCQQTSWDWLTRNLAAVGRMALTNYLMQSLICSFVFYGHGFGQYCELSRIQQFEIVLAIWALQLIWSPLWLKRFRFGPFEWLWRSLSYWRLQKILK